MSCLRMDFEEKNEDKYEGVYTERYCIIGIIEPPL